MSGYSQPVDEQTITMLKMHCITHRPIARPGNGIGILQVGDHDTDIGDRRDNRGDQIAALNYRFSELTGFYYIWKNYASENVGFCHYRRFLIPEGMTSWLHATAAKPYHEGSKGGVANYASGFLLSQAALREHLASNNYAAMLEEQLQGADILLPKSNKLPEGGFLQQYGNAHPVYPFFECLALIGQADNKLARDAHHFFTRFPHAHWNNLFVTRWELYSDYCEFLFPLLRALDEKTPKLPDVYQNRICAFLSERLFNFWVWHRQLKVMELDWCMTEDMVSANEGHHRKRSARNIARDAEASR